MSGFKIITIDDSNIIRKVVNKALKPFNCEVFEAENGADGLVAIHKNKPDLIILDITMPIMNGIEMLAKLKENDETKNIPVIMLTAESSKDTVMQIVSLGVKDYIAKPFKEEQLLERINKYISLEQKKCLEFFMKENDITIISFPEKLNLSLISEIKEELTSIISKGAKKIVTDLTKTPDVNSNQIQLLGFIISTCKKDDIKPMIILSNELKQKLQGYEETASGVFALSLDESKQMLEQ